MPLITVIVPVYKVEPYLHRCIDSILGQTFTDFTLILVDDGSPDRCGEICDEYARKDSRIVVIHQENQGLSAARNAGIDWAFANSDSEWITFIDSDDWVHKDFLKSLYDAGIEYYVDISSCRALDTSEYICDVDLPKNRLKASADEAWVRSTRGSAWGKLYKKELFKEVRYPIGKLHEDGFTTYKVWFKCKYAAFVDAKLYYYYSNPSSIIRTNYSIRRLDEVEAIDEQIRFFKKHKYTRSLKDVETYLFDVLTTGILNLQKQSQYKKTVIRLRRKLRWHLLFHGNLIFISSRKKHNKYVLIAAYPQFMDLIRRFMKRANRRKYEVDRR